MCRQNTLMPSANTIRRGHESVLCRQKVRANRSPIGDRVQKRSNKHLFKEHEHDQFFHFNAEYLSINRTHSHVPSLNLIRTSPMPAAAAAAAAAARTRSLASPEAAAPTLPAQSPVRRHIPSYERMMANTCDAPPTPISCRQNRAGRGLLQARLATGAASSPSSRPAEESESRSSARARSRRSSRAASESGNASEVLVARYKRVWGEGAR